MENHKKFSDPNLEKLVLMFNEISIYTTGPEAFVATEAFLDEQNLPEETPEQTALCIGEFTLGTDLDNLL